MLERVFVVRHVIIVIVGIGKEAIARGKHVAGTDVWRGQLRLVRLFDGKHFLGIIVEVLAQLIAKVRIGVTVPDDFDGLGGAN